MHVHVIIIHITIILAASLVSSPSVTPSVSALLRMVTRYWPLSGPNTYDIVFISSIRISIGFSISISIRIDMSISVSLSLSLSIIIIIVIIMLSSSSDTNIIIIGSLVMLLLVVSLSYSP